MIATFDPPDTDLEEWFEELRVWDERETESGSPLIRHEVSYGHSSDQVIDVWTPDGAIEDLLVVSLHGGFFADAYARDINTALCRSLARAGYEVWNVEYRRAKPGTGGLVETTTDVCAAIETAAATRPARRIAVIGHSAGGYLAEWAASLDAVDLVVLLGAVTDLEDSAASGADEGAIADWLGLLPGVTHLQSRLELRLPAGCSHVLIHGAEDRTVPAAQSIRYAAAINDSGDTSELVLLPETGHYALIDPRQRPFKQLLTILADK